MVCLDTSFVVDVLRGNTAVQQLHKQLSSETVCLPTPVIAELWEGMSGRNLRKGEREAAERFLRSVQILPLDEAAAKRAGELRAELKRTGVSISRYDELIAAITLLHGETLVTRDADFAKVSGLRLMKY